MNSNDSSTSLIMIFGATGDLAKRKLYPSLYHLYKKGKLADHFAVIGTARRPWSHEEFRENIKDSIHSFVGADEQIDDFSSHFYYQPHDVTDSDSYIQLKTLAEELDTKYSLQGNRIFYLAMAPEFFGTIADHLKADGLTDTTGFKRLVIEKPFGHDLESAEQLNAQIRQSFPEEEIYRIDHYLGKAMVQNIEVIRFANAFFEPLWNNRYISNIQITSSEKLGVEERARYYETSGALRDMVQNHMLQMLALLAMEPPIRLTTDEIRSEKVKVFRALRPIEGNEVNEYFVRGQYGPGTIDKNEVVGYRDEMNVDPDSQTETFVAGKLMIDNFRWAGVPFYIRTGKRMTTKSTKIVIQFKDIPMNLYNNNEQLQPNLLVIHIQPDEGITLHLNAKKSGQNMQTNPVKLNFSNEGSNGINTPEAYEKLLYDCLHGDATNFTHWDEVALSWKFVDKISEVWEQTNSEIPKYASGTMGPEEAEKLIENDGFFWWNLNDLDVENCD
ncbi:glucose-6-phosphate dehydrogenase [Heyndrickxia sporothermodurans]|uniref:Glucose-6-phosphate 1-dehydrogenase n=1 Tax=Heyndrickxia sporothermodurans TaxID=46224 RepID=A0A150KM71_9BACI|nr:glucose-6-phosphate dehydrogenase [Heyndrickxia sporothermodurans]KYC95143.1 Glucose-6-phosphate 1-dehydrogenase [Heyndrickxia sporothermodurans]MBL5769427.1 glucose-6-phosphate dehydrogenase [Heyndrickxia sporothermodurans]MBL5773208.1 glucose-6-phosphate dehydrogenase [Heyndrickxia sporothermodurans]MBL5779244.1 glucose-6-phosphate dehydrogenase [Heyndrickxia sporothermodurans]MBL5781246.1 glucose-6-phosphate dehydrogenase [Heyndrickxia sporothermodurans]